MVGSLLAVARKSGTTFSLVRWEKQPWLLLGRSPGGLCLWAPLTKLPFPRQLSLAWSSFPENKHLNYCAFPGQDADPRAWGLAERVCSDLGSQVAGTEGRDQARRQRLGFLFPRPRRSGLPFRLLIFCK